MTDATVGPAPASDEKKEEAARTDKVVVTQSLKDAAGPSLELSEAILSNGDRAAEWDVHDMDPFLLKALQEKFETLMGRERRVKDVTPFRGLKSPVAARKVCNKVDKTWLVPRALNEAEAKAGRLDLSHQWTIELFVVGFKGKTMVIQALVTPSSDSSACQVIEDVSALWQKEDSLNTEQSIKESRVCELLHTAAAQTFGKSSPALPPPGKKRSSVSEVPLTPTETQVKSESNSNKKRGKKGDSKEGNNNFDNSDDNNNMDELCKTVKALQADVCKGMWCFCVFFPVVFLTI